LHQKAVNHNINHQKLREKEEKREGNTKKKRVKEGKRGRKF